MLHWGWFIGHATHPMWLVLRDISSSLSTWVDSWTRLLNFCQEEEMSTSEQVCTWFGWKVANAYLLSSTFWWWMWNTLLSCQNVFFYILSELDDLWKWYFFNPPQECCYTYSLEGNYQHVSTFLENLIYNLHLWNLDAPSWCHLHSSWRGPTLEEFYSNEFYLSAIWLDLYIQ